MNLTDDEIDNIIDQEGVAVDDTTGHGDGTRWQSRRRHSRRRCIMITDPDLDKLIALHPDRRTLCRMVEMLATAEERTRCSRVARECDYVQQSADDYDFDAGVRQAAIHIEAAILEAPHEHA